MVKIDRAGKELVKLMADTWRKNGGDAEGFFWMKIYIYDRLSDLEQWEGG